MDLTRVFAFRVRFSSVKTENGKRHSCTRKDGDPFGEQQTGPDHDRILANLLPRPPLYRTAFNDRFRGRGRVEIAVHLDSGREERQRRRFSRRLSCRNERVLVLLQDRDEHPSGRKRSKLSSGWILERDLLIEKRRTNHGGCIDEWRNNPGN